MRVLARLRLDEFSKVHADARQQALALLAEFGSAAWQTPHDVKQRFPSASIIGQGRVVFNLKGNRYRVDTKVDYERQQILIVRVGTHADYDRWTF
jgi:mRNA interferase HigB